MNKNIIIVFAGAIVVAVLVALLVQVSLKSNEPVPKNTAQEARVEILVADKNLALGRELSPGDLRWQNWPKSGVFPGAVIRKDSQSADEVLQGRLARNIAEGEPVMKSALLDAAGPNFVAASLEPGMRAVSIEVSASSMVAGFIGPGDYVDVILTYKETIRSPDEDPRIQNMIAMNLDKLATETILQKVKILAVDQSAQRPEDNAVKVGKTVTLAVTVQDAEKIALAEELGHLTLSLRGVGDEELVEKKWKTISDARLTTVADEIFQEYEKIKKESGINSNTVRIYNGANVQAVPAK